MQRGDVRLGYTEDDGERLQLRDDDEAGRVGGRDDVADVHRTEADDTRDGSGDLRVFQLETGVGDGTLVDLDRAFELGHLGAGGIELLTRDGLGGVLVTLEVEFGIGERGAITGELAFGLGQRNIERTRVDVGERIPGLHGLAFGEIKLHQLAADARTYGDGVQGLDGAERRDADLDVARSDGRGGHGHREITRPFAASLGAARRLAALLSLRADGGRQREKKRSGNETRTDHGTRRSGVKDDRGNRVRDDPRTVRSTTHAVKA